MSFFILDKGSFACLISCLCTHSQSILSKIFGAVGTCSDLILVHFLHLGMFCQCPGDLGGVVTNGAGHQTQQLHRPGPLLVPGQCVNNIYTINVTWSHCTWGRRTGQCWRLDTDPGAGGTSGPGAGRRR